MTGIPARPGPSQPAHLVRTGMPDWTRPMRATLTHESYSSGEWAYRHKLYGERCLVLPNDLGLRIFLRNLRRLDDSDTELVDA